MKYEIIKIYKNEKIEVYIRSKKSSLREGAIGAF
jgi:hypothetical protein